MSTPIDRVVITCPALEVALCPACGAVPKKMSVAENTSALQMPRSFCKRNLFVFALVRSSCLGHSFAIRGLDASRQNMTGGSAGTYSERETGSCDFHKLTKSYPSQVTTNMCQLKHFDAVLRSLKAPVTGLISQVDRSQHSEGLKTFHAGLRNID